MAITRGIREELRKEEAEEPMRKESEEWIEVDQDRPWRKKEVN